MTTTLWAVSDLHAPAKKNAARVDEIQPNDPSDWLIVAGDVGERVDLVLRVLEKLARRFAQVIWVPGNHELFSSSREHYRGRAKYDAIVAGCRAIGVLTPEDDYPIFAGVTIVPLFTLYDYSFRPPGTTVEQALAKAEEKSIQLTDEVAIAPFVDIKAWCWERLAYSIKRLSCITGPTILVNHWPLVQEPTQKLRFPEISLWCGTRHTRMWPTRYHAQAVVYGHLHIPSVDVVEGVRHIEASLGYPPEWENQPTTHQWPYPVLTAEAPQNTIGGRTWHA